MIIDAHVHVGAAYGAWASSPENLIRMADRLGFDKIIASHLLSLHYDMEEGDRELAQIMKRYPGRILGYAAVPTAWWGARGAEHLRRCLEDYGMVGLKVYTQSKGPLNPEVMVSINHPHMYPVLEVASEYRVPVLAHISPEDCEALAQAFPEATLLMAHMGNTAIANGDWHRAIAAAERCPNIYLDTCSSTVDMGFIEAAVEAVGAERVIFGSDMLFLNPHVALAKITGAELGEEDKGLILGGNMERILAQRSKW